mgnify:CR=1 FL=1
MAKANKKNFDIIVVGNNWTGLSLANSLAKTKSVALINSFENKNAYQSSDEFSGEFEYLPNKSESMQKIQWFSNKHNLNIQSSEKSVTPVTIDSGKLVQFLGFGERDGKSIDNLTWYNEAECIELSVNNHDIRNKLIESFTGDVFENSEVTELHITDSNIESITLNGQKKITATKIIFCEPPNKLLQIIDHKNLPTKIKQKITKINW